jgi:hypothetical protein
MTRLAVIRWKIGSIVDVISAGSGLLCVTSSHIILFKPETGDGSLSYFEGAANARRACVRSSAGVFYVLSHSQAAADIGVYEMELQHSSATRDGRAEVDRRISEVAATSSRMKALDSIQASLVCRWLCGVEYVSALLFAFVSNSLRVLQDPITKALEYVVH